MTSEQSDDIPISIVRLAEMVEAGELSYQQMRDILIVACRGNERHKRLEYQRNWLNAKRRAAKANINKV